MNPADMIPPKTDLFGEVPVTWQDVERWLVHVAKLDPTTSRAERYFRDFNVPAKIRAAKRAGTFDELPESISPRPFWAR